MKSENTALRVALIAIFFFCGLGCILFGKSLSGQMNGLLIMCLGLGLLLVALWIYNRPYADKPNSKR